MLLHYGSEAQRELYLPKMVTGEWTGTMNLTEPQAGSDVGALTTRAVPADDGTWRITGQKIFITYGEHDLADNIVHLVLARVPDAPPGTKGISCFIVPKFLVGDDGSLGARNAVECVSIEHKMGINASPTCVMAYDDAVGYLIGEPNQGMRYMFKMMNTARLSVGLSGLALGERAYQQAVVYAGERTQGRAPGATADSAIIDHPDVRRMLLTMKAHVEALRCLVYLNAEAIDLAKRAPRRGGAGGEPGAGRHPHADHQGVGHRRRRRADLARACRFTVAWATSRRPASPSTTGTSASPRSTRAPTASRRSTSSAASSVCAGAQRSPATSTASRRPPPRRWRPAVSWLRSVSALDGGVGHRALDDRLAARRRQHRTTPWPVPRRTCG